MYINSMKKTQISKKKKSLESCINKKCKHNLKIYNMIEVLTEYLLRSSIKNYKYMTNEIIEHNFKVVKDILEINSKYKKCLNTKCYKANCKYKKYLQSVIELSLQGKTKLLKMLHKLFTELYELEN